MAARRGTRACGMAEHSRAQSLPCAPQAIDWPAELEISLHLNREMRAYDGANLTYDSRDGGVAPPVAAAISGPPAYGPPIRRFRTPSLRMWTGAVRSEMAHQVTNGSWSASLHPLLPDAVELPPDGTLELRFSSDVDLALLQGRPPAASCRDAALSPRYFSRD